MNEVWYVVDEEYEGDIPLLWRTKMDAEIYARRLFPDESPDARYARVRFIKLLAFDRQKGDARYARVHKAIGI